VKGLLAVSCGHDLITLIGQNASKGTEDLFLIINDKYAPFFHENALLA
jgi:hypothetical protein